jgi:hypothetical protein
MYKLGSVLSDDLMCCPGDDLQMRRGRAMI